MFCTNVPITSMDTMKKCRTHSWTPNIGVRGNIDRKEALDNYMMSQGVDKTLLTDIQDLITHNREDLK